MFNTTFPASQRGFCASSETHFQLGQWWSRSFPMTQSSKAVASILPDTTIISPDTSCSPAYHPAPPPHVPNHTHHLSPSVQHPSCTKVYHTSLYPPVPSRPPPLYPPLSGCCPNYRAPSQSFPASGNQSRDFVLKKNSEKNWDAMYNFFICVIAAVTSDPMPPAVKLVVALLLLAVICILNFKF